MLGGVTIDIEISNLCFSYREGLFHKKTILNQLSLSIQKGSCVAIVGANGCGKSTLLSLLSGVLLPKSGDINYFGTDMKKVKGAFSTLTSYVPQENPLLPELTVWDHLRLFYPGSAMALRQVLAEPLLATLSLSELLPIPVFKLSGGMKRRVTLALAFLNQPALLLLDEPSTTLDLPYKQEIKSHLLSYQKCGGTIVFTTHEESELSLCSELYVLKNGSLHPISASLRGYDLMQAIQTNVVH